MINATNLTNSGSGTGATSYATASISPAPSQLILATFESRTAITADPTQPTASGCNLTWVVIASLVFDTTSSTRKRITLFRGMGTNPTTGAITFDEAGQSQTNATWIVDQLSGTNLTGTNGSGAIVQFATNKDETVTSPSITVTLSNAFTSTNNATYIAGVNDNLASTATVSADFTVLASPGDALYEDVATAYSVKNKSSGTLTWSSNAILGGIIVEIAASHNFPNNMKVIGNSLRPRSFAPGIAR